MSEPPGDAQTATGPTISYLKAREAHTGLQARRLLCTLDHTLFLVFGCMFIIQDRSKFDVENVGFGESMREVFKDEGL